MVPRATAGSAATTATLAMTATAHSFHVHSLAVVLSRYWRASGEGRALVGSARDFPGLPRSIGVGVDTRKSCKMTLRSRGFCITVPLSQLSLYTSNTTLPNAFFNEPRF
jgi:hypothetical protein